MIKEILFANIVRISSALTFGYILSFRISYGAIPLSLVLIGLMLSTENKKSLNVFDIVFSLNCLLSILGTLPYRLLATTSTMDCKAIPTPEAWDIWLLSLVVIISIFTGISYWITVREQKREEGKPLIILKNTLKKRPLFVCCFLALLMLGGVYSVFISKTCKPDTLLGLPMMANMISMMIAYYIVCGLIYHRKSI